MKSLLIGAAIGALLLPASVKAQDHDHGCFDEGCTVYSIFQDVPAVEGASGFQGVDAPRYGTWGFDTAGMDRSVSPGDSFMRYANGAALDRMVIPSDRTSYGSFALLRELSDNRLKVMIEGLAGRTDLQSGTDEQKIADAYRSYMDTERVEQLDAQPLQPYLAAIRAADDHEKIAAYMGGTVADLGDSFFGTGITTDQKAPNRYVVSAGQGGLGLPNRDYYLSPLYADKKDKYQAYVARMLEMVGWDDPSGSAAAIVAMETAIAEAHWTPIENRNRDRTYNEYTIQQLVADAPGFDWVGYFNAAELGDIPRLIVRQNTALPKIATIFAEAPVETLQAWQAFHTVDAAAPSLSRRFSDAQWEFRVTRPVGAARATQPRQARNLVRRGRAGRGGRSSICG